jgi:hypothetical protein
MGHVYFIRDESSGLTKIGATGNNDVAVRLRQLQTGNPSLKLAWKYEAAEPFGLENLLHGRYALKRREQEFFDLDDADIHDAQQFCDECKQTTRPTKDRASSLQNVRDNGVLLDPAEAHRQIVAELQQVNREYMYLEAKKKALENQLKTIIGINAGIEGLCTWKSSVTSVFNEERLKLEQLELWTRYSPPRLTLDRTLLKQEQPDIWSKYLQEKFTRRFYLTRAK